MESQNKINKADLLSTLDISDFNSYSVNKRVESALELLKENVKAINGRINFSEELSIDLIVIDCLLQEKTLSLFSLYNLILSSLRDYISKSSNQYFSDAECLYYMTVLTMFKLRLKLSLYENPSSVNTSNLETLKIKRDAFNNFND